MLGFMFRNYDDLVQRYVVYDDGSTDGSLDILAAHPKVEIRIRRHIASELAHIGCLVAARDMLA